MQQWSPVELQIWFSCNHQYSYHSETKYCRLCLNNLHTVDTVRSPAICEVIRLCAGVSCCRTQSPHVARQDKYRKSSSLNIHFSSAKSEAHLKHMSNPLDHQALECRGWSEKSVPCSTCSIVRGIIQTTGLLNELISVPKYKSTMTRKWMLLVLHLLWMLIRLSQYLQR